MKYHVLGQEEGAGCYLLLLPPPPQWANMGGQAVIYSNFQIVTFMKN